MQLDERSLRFFLPLEHFVVFFGCILDGFLAMSKESTALDGLRSMQSEVCFVFVFPFKLLLTYYDFKSYKSLL